MTIEQLRQLWKAEPFRPFVIHLANGKEIAVQHPEFLMPLRGGRTVLVASPTEEDAYDIIDVMLVTNLEVKPAPGSRNRKKAG